MGTVVSSDEAGNIYKKLVVQDATGALVLAIDQGSLYEEYPQGCGVAVNLTGLVFGRYSNSPQVGMLDGNRVNRIPLETIAPHILVDPRRGQLDTVTVDASLLGSPRDSQNLIKYYGRLVRIRNLKFENPGAMFAPGETTSLTVTDPDGTRYEVRSSSFADFAYDRAPEGTGDIVGILGYYNSTWQIELNNAAGLIGFDGSSNPSGPDDPAAESLTLLQSTSANGLLGWTIEKVKGDRDVWSWASYNSAYYLNATAFGSETENESWAVSPVVDLSAVKSATVSFEHAAKFQTTIKELCGFYVREAGSQAWQKLDIPQWPAPDAWNWKSSEDIDLSAFAGKLVQVAFKYAGSAAGSDQWEIRNLLFRGEGGAILAQIPDEPVNPGTTELLNEAFNGTLGNFTIENADLGDLEAVWTASTKYSCALATGYVSSDKTNHAVDSYLVSPVIDLTAATKPALAFDHAINYFQSLEVAKTQATVAVREAGTTAWTAVAVPNYGDNAGFTFVSSGKIDLSAFNGKKVQIAFHYTSTAAKAGTWEVKNVAVADSKE